MGIYSGAVMTTLEGEVDTGLSGHELRAGRPETKANALYSRYPHARLCASQLKC